MVVGALVWLSGELLAVFTGRSKTDTTSAWVWMFEGKTGVLGKIFVAAVMLYLTAHLVFGIPLIVIGVSCSF